MSKKRDEYVYRENKGPGKKVFIPVYSRECVKSANWDWIKSSNYYVYKEKKTLSKKTLTTVYIAKSRD